MNQTLAQISLARTRRTVRGEIEYLRPSSMEPSLAARIWSTISGVSFFARLAETVARILPPVTAWRMFSVGEHHSRFATELFAFLKSMWFTCASGVGGGPRNAAATNRCTLPCATELPLERLTSTYPARSSLGLRMRPGASRVLLRLRTVCGRLLTLPKELTSYNPSYPAIGSHFSIQGSVSR